MEAQTKLDELDKRKLTTRIRPFNSKDPITYLGYKITHAKSDTNETHISMKKAKDKIKQITETLGQIYFTSEGKTQNAHALLGSTWRYAIPTITEINKELETLQNEVQTTITKYCQPNLIGEARFRDRKKGGDGVPHIKAMRASVATQYFKKLLKHPNTEYKNCKGNERGIHDT